MLRISYDNVMNGLNQSISVSCICPTQCEADHLFRNAIDLWYIQGFSEVSNLNREIIYGKVQIRFRNFDLMSHSSWKGFRGIFLFHPYFHPEKMSDRDRSKITEMDHNNTRYIEKWQS